MVSVRVTVTIAGRTVPIEELADLRLAGALRNAGQDVAQRLGRIECPVHQRTATNVRVHFDARGNADLQYESCCEALGTQIGQALG
jgi:hypothetical protein